MLQTILISLENLSENFRRLKEEHLQWSNPEQQMEEEEQGRADQAVLDDLLKEVPLTQSPASEPISVPAVSLPQFSMATPEISLVQSAPVSTLNLIADGKGIPISAIQTNVPVQSMAQTSFGGFKFMGGNFSSDPGAKFNWDAVPSTSYPRLDGHSRRITPAPVSSTRSQPKISAVPKSSEEIQRDLDEFIKKHEKEKAEQEMVANQYKTTGFNYEPMRKKTTPDSTVNLINSTEESSGANGPTIGSTTISSVEAETIKKEVRDCVQQVFRGINLSTHHTEYPNMRFGKDGSGKPNAKVIDLSGSTAHFVPLAIAGSDVSVASTLSKTGHGESNTSFSRIMSGSEAITSAQTFATA